MSDNEEYKVEGVVIDNVCKIRVNSEPLINMIDNTVLSTTSNPVETDRNITRNFRILIALLHRSGKNRFCHPICSIIILSILETKVDSITTQIQSLNEKIDSLDSRIYSLNASLNEMKEAIEFAPHNEHYEAAKKDFEYNLSLTQYKIK